jgi:hypothetical protein
MGLGVVIVILIFLAVPPISCSTPSSRCWLEHR